MLVKDVMTREVVTATPDIPVVEIARRLGEHRISALPVIDQAGTVLGIVSEGDLLRRRELDTERRRSWWLQIFADPDLLARDFTRAHGQTAADVMSSPVICIDETATLAAAADMLESHRVKRLPVLRDGKLIGIVSRADLVRALTMQPQEQRATGVADDRAIERALRERLVRQPWATSVQMNAVVQDGAVELWGYVGSEEQRRAVRVLAGEIPGVRRIEDHLVLGPVPAGA